MKGSLQGSLKVLLKNTHIYIRVLGKKKLQNRYMDAEINLQKVPRSLNGIVYILYLRREYDT